MAGSRRVELPINLLLAELLGDLVVIHFLHGFTELSRCANKVGSVVAPNLVYRASAGDKTIKCVQELVCFERVSDFDVNCSAYKASEQCSVSFAFLAAFVTYGPKKSTLT